MRTWRWWPRALLVLGALGFALTVDLPAALGDGRIALSGQDMARARVAAAEGEIPSTQPAPASTHDGSASPDASAPEAVADGEKSAEPDEIIVGAFINDVQELDFRTHSYAVDLYIWFRWRNAELDPSKSMEFMNRYAPADHERDAGYEEPQKMPDGSLYAIVRNQGRFSTKLILERYPFDRQELKVVIEDSTGGITNQVFVADSVRVAINEAVSVPGFRLGIPRLEINANSYPTNFGDLTVGEAESYSRATIVIPIERPLFALSVKTFLPILLILACASLVLFIRPHFVDARVGLSITALLTLVALQLAGGSSLPEIDYLTLVDKVFLASYAFIMLVLARVVYATWRGDFVNGERSVVALDRAWLLLTIVGYVVVLGAVAIQSLSG